MECPICKGTGNVSDRCEKLDDAALRKKAVLLLREHGYGVRETQRVIGYRSPRSVSAILNAERKKPNDGSGHNTAQQTLDYLDALIPGLVPDNHKWSPCEREYYESIVSNLKALAVCPNGAHNTQSAVITQIADDMDATASYASCYHHKETASKMREWSRQLRTL